MPITRRDAAGDPLDRHIGMIWNKKWLILGIAFCAAILTYVVLLFVPETYRVKAELYVNRLPAAPDEETANPETVTSLLKSQAVIEKVRNDYATEFDISPPPPLESFAKAFSVETSILQDTTVRKQFSPVLQLQVDSRGSSDTRFIMDSWIRNFVKLFGNYSTEEALIKRQAYIAEKERLEDEISSVEQLRAEYDAKLPYLKKILAEKLDMLTPSRLYFQDSDVDTVKLDFTIQNPRMRPGLLERFSELKLMVATGSAPSTASVELAALATSIEDARSSITSAQQELGDARFKQQQTIRHLEQLTANQKAVNEAVSRFMVASAVFNQKTTDGVPAAADVRALAAPVTPETRVWPKRTLSAAVVAIVAAILTIFALLARNFLTKVSSPDSQ